MKMMDLPCAFRVRMIDHQRVGLLRRQYRRRFVENEDLGVVAQGLEDLDALLLADGEILDRRRRVDMEVVLLGEARRCVRWRFGGR